MAQLVRTWLGLGALGAGTIHLAVAAGSSTALLVVFGVIGLAEVAWGVSALALPALVRPGLAIAGAMLPVAVWLAVLFSGGSEGMGGMQGMSGMSGMSPAQMSAMTPALPTGAMLGATALDLLVAAGIALAVRRAVPARRAVPVPAPAQGAEPEPERPLDAAHPWRYLGGMLVGAAVVAVITANSLAATPVGAGGMAGMTGMGH